VDHVVLTGSVETGKAVLRQCAETLTPVTMELSGCDAVFVLPGADLERVIAALGFGLRFNGSATCMAPRRVFLVGLAEDEASWFEGELATALDWLVDVRVAKKTEMLLRELIDDALSQGARVLLNGIEESGVEGEVAATLITEATPALKAMQAEIFAPILSVMRAANLDEALAASAACPYALTASVFGPEKEARTFASKLRVGNVLINDIIVPTADPRVPFGGRGWSGFGVTRGAEGLLGMTTPRTIQTQRSRSKRAYAARGDEHVDLFAGMAQMLHGKWNKRWTGFMRLVRAARGLK
jgi:acyl-CoA reductase-like NAD-dependent aldehyde dehydrogenase